MTWIRTIGIALLATYGLLSQPAGTPLTFTLDAPSIVGGNSVTATITLSTAAPAGGALVTVTNPAGTTVQAGANQSGIQQIGLTKILVPAGLPSVTFRLLTGGVAANAVATLTATSGSDQAAASLVITPARPRSVIIARGFITGGQTVTATIQLDGTAPREGVDVSLSVGQPPSTTSDGSVRFVNTAQSPVTVPAVAHFNIGASSASVSVTTIPVLRDTPGFVTATVGGVSASGVLTVRAPTVSAVQVAPAIVVAGNGSTGTVTLSGPAPAGLNVSLSAVGTGASIPSLLPVTAGASSATFPIATTAPGVGSSVNVSTTAGSSATVSITARIPTTAGPPPTTTITDGSSNTIQTGEPAGSNTATLTVLPPVVLQSTSVSPSPVPGGTPITLAINIGTGTGSSAISVSAPTTVVAGTAQISVDQPLVVQLPATATILARSGVVPVNGTTSSPAADVTVNVTTTFAGVARTSTLLVKAPIPPLESFSVRPAKVAGGLNVIASLKLSSSITQATLVTLSTDRPDLIQLPRSVTVPAGGVPLALTITTPRVSTETTVTITATAGVQKLETKLVIAP